MWSAVDPETPPLAAVFSVGSYELSAKEQDLFRQANPLGFILFARNCNDPEQLKQLTGQLCDAVGRICPVLIDQEGGRVQRLKPPCWRKYPSARQFGKEFETDRQNAVNNVYSNALAMAGELTDQGINVNCAPVLDLLLEQTHDVIGDRAFSEDSETVQLLGSNVCRGFIDAGVTPVIKHMPGHGRAASDSHLSLPIVSATKQELQADFAPFKSMASTNFSHHVWGMTSHVVYEAFDPDLPASISSGIIGEVIRGEIGFESFLITDDLAMKALDSFGDVEQRANRALEAGNDAVLHCSGSFEEMEKLAEHLPKLNIEAVQRLNDSVIKHQGV